MEAIIGFLVISGFFYNIQVQMKKKKQKPKPMAVKKTGPRAFPPSPFETSGVNYDIPTYYRKGIVLDFNNKPSTMPATSQEPEFESEFEVFEVIA